MKISDKDEILEKLGLNAIEDGYRPVAVHALTRSEDTFLGTKGCERIDIEANLRKKDGSMWKKEEEELGPKIFAQLAEAAGRKGETLTFGEAYDISDMLIAEQFEGLPMRYNFTDEEWTLVTSLQMPRLIKTYSEAMIKAQFTRVYRPILNYMKNKVRPGSETSSPYPSLDLSFIIYSMHDTQVSHWLHMLQPTNIDMSYIQYASTIFTELHRKDTPECE